MLIYWTRFSASAPLQLREEKRNAAAEEASFPVIMQIVPKCVFNKKDPIVVGVDIVEGVARLGTPMCAKHGDEFVDIGRISSMEVNHKVVSKVSLGLLGTIPTFSPSAGFF